MILKEVRDLLKHAWTLLTGFGILLHQQAVALPSPLIGSRWHVVGLYPIRKEEMRFPGNRKRRTQHCREKIERICLNDNNNTWLGVSGIKMPVRV
jgi:hypothetical protein